ncbi:efflux RND transporter periplasmic adaptor subunit [Microvirga tunisiensis]|uniref:Efflux RND transporter periplasmic adaptor subunit n=1 Tax=Pannonibacter tanglangensis TaxID=2750084 RepID=A0A7X5F3G3_9HYPH|nr:efflux RND transporter periplasmic adaptor subunit [Pannonibacter sp. XCT-53]NBN79018.1 efflux RND transporter periplasmic adaptor subunit [Pannonibacter sp. XCT-53]
MRIVKPALVLLAVAAAVAAFLFWTNRPPEVAVVSPSRGTAADVVYATASVEPVIWAKVTSLLRERLVELCDCEGRSIRAGDVLAELDAGDARATLKELEARQSLSLSEQERALELMQRRVISQQVYDKALSEYSQISALLAAQRERLNDYTIRAPISGLVLRQDGSVGEVVAPGEILFWIGQPSPLRLVADVNEEDIPQVAPGQKALIRADAFPGQALTATVDRITPMGDPVLKNYRVYLALPEDTPLRVGMTVELNIVTREVPDALLVPTAALDGTEVLTVADDGTLARQPVGIGIRGVEASQVLSGLDPDARLVSPFRDDLKPGQRIAPVADTDGAKP